MASGCGPTENVWFRGGQPPLFYFAQHCEVYIIGLIVTTAKINLMRDPATKECVL